MKEIPQQMQNEIAQAKDKLLKMPVVVHDVEYRPSYTITVEHAEDLSACLCCGATGGGWVQCVENIVEHGSDDVHVMQEIENKLRVIVKEIEEGMAVCEKCNYTQEFLARRPKLYKKVFKEVLYKHNGREYTTEW